MRTGGRSITEPDAGARAPVALHFDTGKLGCLLPILASCVLVAGWWAVRPEALGDGGRRSGLVETIRPMMAGGFNIPLLALALYLLWVTAQMLMRWADDVAVRADEIGLDFHRTLLRRQRVRWDEVRSVRRGIARQEWSRVSEIVFVLSDRSVRLRGFQDREGAVEAFLDAVRERRRLASAPGAPPEHRATF